MGSIWKPHVTVAAVIEQHGRYLVVEESIEGKTVYNQPAGHLEPGESLIDAVIRETREESAWRFTPEALTGIYLWDQPGASRTFLRFAFCGAHSHHRPEQSLDQGILRALWLSRDELAARAEQLRSPLVLQCIDDHAAGRRYPLDCLHTLMPAG